MRKSTHKKTNIHSLYLRSVDALFVSGTFVYMPSGCRCFGNLTTRPQPCGRIGDKPLIRASGHFPELSHLPSMQHRVGMETQ